ncbi:N-acetylmuramoyl-L-alanine amidase [Sphingomonas sp. H39-1-10]|uniref:N-acetylmuramoyl-L-alanine amidase n=1 Tax=Sphingomonas pollutisoli TaxID=3030829 RepID=UPI0023B982F5|nr:N-acetylmuramoyl-L-alanine amidase [Sphingomonas pollutisoli]MDF0490877.1 N-acetylmuramoyl-L-alanine amidase [Sphingomonas pollutisoli]
MPFRWTGRAQTRHYARVLVILALLACWFTGAPGWAATVQRIDVRRDRIVLHFDRGVADASAILLARPRRIAVDVAGAVPGHAVSGAGLVTAVRQSRHGTSGLRILFDLARPAVVREGSFGDGGRDLTIALRSVDDATFARAADEGRVRFLPPLSFGTRRSAARKYQVAVPIPPSSRKLRLPRIYGDDASRPLVVIDAGHGGQDPGAIAPTDGRREKDVTLRIAKAIRDELVESGRVRVALTREDDRFIVLQERFGIARKLHASLFISIHCDSVGSGDASGASVYTLSEVASDKESARLAARENKADIIAGVNLASTSADISSILIDLTQRETMNSSASFARLLGREAQPLVPMKPNFHRMASLMVLKAPDMPSILFETGYISNPRDADFIDSDAGRHAIAESVRRAVDVHFARRLASTR